MVGPLIICSRSFSPTPDVFPIPPTAPTDVFITDFFLPTAAISTPTVSVSQTTAAISPATVFLSPLSTLTSAPTTALPPPST